MTLGDFLWDRLGRLVLLLAAGAGSILFLSLTGTQPGILAILGLVWAILFLAVQAVDFLKCRGRLLELEAILEGLDQKHLFAECLPRPETARERALFGLMRRAGKGAVEAVSDARAAQREYREYIESWVHEIKTPITAARLICRGADSVLRRKLITELSQIENHVERALFYARAESPEQDFLIRQSSLEAIAAEAIEQHRSLLIQSGVRIETQGLEQMVYTDGKWACFLLGQLLQNAVRYRNPEPVIVLAAKPLGRQVQLTVSDNGLGIPAQELPRIFDRGFTGSNGRARGGSTGMGLYLCRKLAAMLEIRLEARSLEGQGTAVILTFPARETLP
ncbi:HAMP domain-containing sensor histidine kinase [uncultured Acetatifactor sp.]|uniref:sensor histidine kinase n=1 Tax=uncultured Acetatifactor sp. TaxID=1671927 RepID=UPI002625A4A5|nr:sensor histidine kinase [uncultured Acetatifactor sp.]